MTVPQRDTSYFDDAPGEYDETQYRRCVALWRAVMLQAFTDMASQTTISWLIGEKHKASHWLTTCSNDLYFVCDAIGRSPREVMARAKRVAQENSLNWKLPPKQAKDYEKRKEYKRKHDLYVRPKKRGKPLITMGIPDGQVWLYHSEIINCSSPL